MVQHVSRTAAATSLRAPAPCMHLPAELAPAVNGQPVHCDAGHPRVINLVNVLLLCVQQDHTRHKAAEVGGQQQQDDDHGVGVEARRKLQDRCVRRGGDRERQQ